MTDKPDIIELVKELQESHAIQPKATWNDFNNACQKHFPRIAESLLIAVEALQVTESWGHADECPEIDKNVTKCGCYYSSVKNALSRIKAL